MTGTATVVDSTGRISVLTLVNGLTTNIEYR